MGYVRLLPAAWEGYIGGWPDLPDELRHGITVSRSQDKLIPPSIPEIYSAFQKINPGDVRVVILCDIKLQQNPLFDFQLHDALARDYGVAGVLFSPAIHWPQQGILFLNNQLTWEEGNHLAHRGLGWEKEIAKVLGQLSREIPGRCYLLWGGEDVESYKQFISPSAGLVLSSPEPANFLEASDYVERRFPHSARPLEWILEISDKKGLKSV